MAGGKIPSILRRSYEGILVALEEAAIGSNAGVVSRRPSIDSCFRIIQEGITFNCYLLLRNWRWRPRSNEHVVIVVHTQEKISRDAKELIKSTVRVSYYTVKLNSADPMHSVRFDYNGETPFHPTFHAQLSRDPVVLPAAEMTELNCDLNFSSVQKLNCFELSRIPTSDMTLTSVLLCLAADHIQGSFFFQFRERLAEFRSAIPRPTITEIIGRMELAKPCLASAHWFP